MTPTEALALIDKHENIIQRMRIDGPLKTAMVADLDRFREFAASVQIVGDRLMIKPKPREFSEEETLAAAAQVMERHKDTLRALADM